MRLRDWKKASRSISSKNYVRRYVPWHPLADRSGYCYEHRLVLWSLGIRLRRGVHVAHHKNRDRRDNRPSNLERLTKRQHDRMRG